MKKILFVFSIVALTASGCASTQQATTVQPPVKVVKNNKPIPPTQSQNTTTPSSTPAQIQQQSTSTTPPTITKTPEITPTPAPAPEPSYKIIKLNTKNTFSISQFPDTTFTLTSVYKVNGLTPGGCNSNLPQEVTKQIRVSGGCFDSSVFVPGLSYSLVGITISVENNSNLTVQGDLIKLAYFEGSQENNILKFAQRDMDFSSYGIAPYENRNIQMSFWLPTKGNPLYLAYGPLASPNQQLPFGQKLMQNFEGALKIDVATSKVSDSK